MLQYTKTHVQVTIIDGAYEVVRDDVAKTKTYSITGPTTVTVNFANGAEPQPHTLDAGERVIVHTDTGNVEVEEN